MPHFPGRWGLCSTDRACGEGIEHLIQLYQPWCSLDICFTAKNSSKMCLSWGQLYVPGAHCDLSFHMHPKPLTPQAPGCIHVMFLQQRGSALLPPLSHVLLSAMPSFGQAPRLMCAGSLAALGTPWTQLETLRSTSGKPPSVAAFRVVPSLRRRLYQMSCRPLPRTLGKKPSRLH